MKPEIITLKYSSTYTFLVRGQSGSLLVDTGYAGTLQAFYRALGANSLTLKQISYVMATHYHPDHCGLIGRLQAQGVQLLLADSQVSAVHFPDHIFAREKLDYLPPDPAKAVLVSAGGENGLQSRPFLKTLGIEGEIIRTPSHSEDSISLVLDDGCCFVGDLEPREYIGAYADNPRLAEDWSRIMRRNPKIIFFAHAPAR